MATTSEIQVTEAYIGLLGRAPDPAGLAYWAAQLDAAVAAGEDPAVALKKLTNDITLNDEWTSSTTGSADPLTLAGATTVVTDMYRNLFERDPSAADITYWTAELMAGTTTASEMAVQLIQGAKANSDATDADVLGYKQAAATYYVETVPQANFSRDSAKNAVDPVSSPTTLQTSKTQTDYVASGTGVTTDLASVAAGANVTVTGGRDVITGTVGTDGTYTTQNILDVYSSDNDSLTLTGDKGFTFDDVTNIENIDVNLSASLGGGFTIDATKALKSTINVDVAPSVTVGGVALTGETVLTVSNLSTSNLTTTDVTKLTADPNGGAVTITGDSDLVVVDLNDLDANDTTLVLSATSVDVDLDGTAGTSDSVSVSGKGAVALDLTDGAQLVEKVTLSGNGAAVTYAITNATAASQTYTVTGDQDVTLSGATTAFNAAKFSDTSTAGSTYLKVTSGAADLDISQWGVLSGGVEIAGTLTTGAVLAPSGATIKISADQNADISFDTNDGTTSSSLTLDIDNDSTAKISTTDIDTLTIDTGTSALSLEELDASDNDAAVSIAGTNDVTFTNAVAAGDLTVNNKAATFTSIDADGDLTVTTSGAFSATGGVTVDNDVVVSSDDINVAGGLSTAASSATDGNVTLTATGNDVDLAGAIDIDGTLTVTSNDAFTSTGGVNTEGALTITADDFQTAAVTVQTGDFSATVKNASTATGDLTVSKGSVTIVQSGGVDKTVTFSGGDNSITAQNDISITAQNASIDGVVTTAGNLVIAADNDILVEAAAATDVSGNITLTSTNATLTSVTTTGTLKADNDITITAADQVAVQKIQTVAGDVVITAGNEVTFDTTASDINGGSLTVTSTSAVAGAGNGIIDVDVALDVDNDIVMTGAEMDIEAEIKSNKNDVTLTATNDINTAASIVATTGDVTVTVSGKNNMDFVMQAAADKLTAANDVTVSADDITVGEIESTAAGNVTLTANNDVTTLGDITTNVGSGSVTITSNKAWVNGSPGITLANGSTIDADNDIVITAASGAEINLDNAILTSSAIGDIKITGGDIDGSGAITATLGDVQLNSTNDSETSTLSGTITADAGKIEILGGKFAISDLDANAGGITIAGDSQGSFGALQTTGSSVRITASNSTQGATGDVSITSIDAATVLAQGSGDYALGTVTSSTTAAVSITSGDGNDSATLNAAGDVYTVSTGGGADSITNTASAATSTINLGAGDDTYTPTATAANATVDMGAGTGDKLVLNGNHSADGVITNYEILSLGGATTMSEGQLDNDATFEIQGANTTITVTGISSLDLSGVELESGNTTKFVLSAGGTGSTLTGSDGVEEFTGGDGAVDVANLGKGADKFSTSTGADTANFGVDSALDTYTIGAVADSDASTAANTTRDFDKLDEFDSGEDKIDIDTVADGMAGGNATGVTVTTLTTGGGSMNDTTIATFAELVTAVEATTLVASAAGAAGAATGIQVYVIDLTGNTGALGTGKYILINNNDTDMDSDDILIEITGSEAPIASDFVIG